MKTNHSLPAIWFFAFILAACNLPSAPAPTPTLDMAAVSTIAAMTLEALPSRTPFPATSQPATPALMPTATATQATPGAPLPILVTDNVNCRSGPGTTYNVLSVIPSGKELQAMGVSPDGQYLLVKYAGHDDCWVFKDLVQNPGGVKGLPTVMPPPLPTGAAPGAPVWSNYTFSCEFASGGSTMTMNLAWTDRAVNEDGYEIFREDQSVVILPPGTTSYVDVAFVASGKSLSYRVEAFNKSGRSPSSTIQAACQ